MYLATLIQKIKFLHNITLFRHSGIYFISNMVVALIPFITMPIITKYISPKEYGVYTLLLALMLFGQYIVSLGLPSAVFKKFMTLPEKRKGCYITTVLLISLITLPFLSFALFLFSEKLQEITLIPIQWQFAALFILFFQTLLTIHQSLLMAEQRPVYYGIFFVIRSIIQAGLTIYFLIWMHMSWQAMIFSQLIIFFLVGIFTSLWLLKRHFLIIDFSLSDAKHALLYSFPLIPFLIGVSIINLSDRFFIKYFLGLEKTGIYAIAYQISIGFTFFSNAIYQAWTPWLFKKLKKQDKANKKQIVQATYLVGIGIIAAGFGYILLAPFLVWFLTDPKFHEAILLTPWLVFGLIFFSLYSLFDSYAGFFEKTKYMSLLMIITIIINLGFNYILIPITGMVGAAQATLASYISMFIMGVILQRYLIKLPWKIKFKELLRF